MKTLCITEHSDRPEAETFIGLKSAGIDLTVITPDTSPHYSRLVEAGVRVINYKFCGRYDYTGIKLIRQLLKSERFDILHMFNNKAVSNGLLASIGINIKTIAYRGIVANVSFFDPGSLLTYLNPRIDRIICVANAIRDYFLNMRLLGYRLPEHKIRTIYKGHDLSWYNQTPVALAEFNIPDNAFVVGCIANNRPRKGIKYLIDAIGLLPAESNIHVLLIGSMDSGNLINEIDNCPNKNRIHLTGFRKDAPAIIAACDTAILPAIKREGLPKAIIEAMVYKVPPIVTNSGGSPELIIHQQSGLIIPPADSKSIAEAIIFLYDHPQRKIEMGEQAQIRIRDHFKNSETIRQTVALYNELIS